MKKSEKILLVLFAILFGVIVGGGLLTYSLKSYRSMTEGNDKLRARLDEMTRNIAQGAEWQGRSDWAQNNIPSFGSLEEARSKLLDVIKAQAQKAEVTIANKEFTESAPAVIGPDGTAEETGSEGYFDKASVKITLNEVQEQALFAWMFALQEPKSFLGITRFQMTPSGKGKTVSCEVEITQFYREGHAAKLTKAD